jgi:hypothetical protein
MESSGAEQGDQPNADDLADLFARILRRWHDVRPGSRESFIAHLRSLTRWEEGRGEPPDVEIPFPKTIWIAVAVCDVGCGRIELIVDGSTQECQHCGSIMFRTSVREYHLTQRSRRANSVDANR